MKTMMKTKHYIATIILTCFCLVSSAQDTTGVEFSTGADLVSRYIWRGIDFGNAPAIQPTIAANYKSFTIGTWGNQSISSNTGGLETDLYATYNFEFGMSITLSDYYFPMETQRISRNLPDTNSLIIVPERNGNYFDFENAHFLEANINYKYKNLYISANYMFYNAADDIYAEIGYNYENLKIFFGAGNESYSTDGNFNICNAGISVSKEIKISKEYNLPVNGNLVINPNLEQIHMVFGISL